MRHKLQKFEEFVGTLLPHEVQYLLNIQQFQDADNLEILRRIFRNCQPQAPHEAFDTAIDKRKYSNLKRWIQTRLESIDVDRQLDWLMGMERRILTDAITPEEEEALLAYLEQYQPPYFYFLKCYELARTYRQYLIVRLRQEDHQRVDAFLDRYRQTYEHTSAIQARLYDATREITGQYAHGGADARSWEYLLRQLVFDSSLDGQTRHLAVIQLTMLCISYREFDKLREIYDYLEQQFLQGEGYSRRLLVNYYGNRLILHTKFGEWQEAARCGYLSIRERNTEYLLYLTNLGAVLLRQGRKAEALALLQGGIPEMRRSNNFHSKVGFVAFYVKCLHDNGQAAHAERYAETFLRSYKDQVLNQRWHIFFTVYLQALLRQEKYQKILSLCRSFKLPEREKDYRRRAAYMPAISWYFRVSQYKEGKIGLEKLRSVVDQDMALVQESPHKRELVRELLDELFHHVPQVFSQHKARPVAA
jgi:hypothetical protein